VVDQNYFAGAQKFSKQTVNTDRRLQFTNMKVRFDKIVISVTKWEINISVHKTKLTTCAGRSKDKSFAKSLMLNILMKLTIRKIGPMAYLQ